MLPLPERIIAVLVPFAALFTKPVWTHVQVLLAGAILCRGPHTVAAVLRVLGFGTERRFEKYHRVLSRAQWSGLQGAKILLGLLVSFLPPGWPVVVGIDETVERRQGRKIKAKGRYRDAVRSTDKTVVKCYGLKWISLMLLVPLPWSTRVWALPFVTVLAPSARANTAAGRRHKTILDWTLSLMKMVSRWLGHRAWVLLGDGTYACVRLARACTAAVRPVPLISRLRLDARLYAFPGPPAPHRRGPKPRKGKRCQALEQRLAEAHRRGKAVEVSWYGGTTKRVRLLSDCCLWYTPGELPVAIRWVLVVDPTARHTAMAVFSTDLDLTPEQIVTWFVQRWNVEVTFEETRRHLGVETQRQWSDRAIARTTPALWALFSLVCLMAHALTMTGSHLPLRLTAWYRKTEAPFSDVLAMVRRVLWADKYFHPSTVRENPILFRHDEWEVLLDPLAFTA